MERFIRVKGTAVAINKDNIDTDQLLPKQFLTGISRVGYGQHLLYDWRYLDGDATRPNPDFILNQEQGRQASILISGKNFGCGSSREHAPWAIADYGFKAIIAKSFADIFYNNCLNNGILPVQLSSDRVDDMMSCVDKHPETSIVVDLQAKIVSTEDLGDMPFTIAETARENLLNGWDKIGKTLNSANMIEQFEMAQPDWLR